MFGEFLRSFAAAWRRKPPPAQAVPVDLCFTMKGQEQTNWCWAAVTQSIATFYRVPSMNQCALVGKILGLQSNNFCCGNGGTPICNQQWYLHLALGAVQCLHGVVGRARPAIPLEEVKFELGLGQPVGVRVEWAAGPAKGGGHFVVISGWKQGASGDAYVTVQDPWGPSTEQMPIQEFADNYGTDKGVWTHSYFTLPPKLAGLLGGSHQFIVPSPDLLGG